LEWIQCLGPAPRIHSTNKEEANRVLWGFLPRYNPRFVVPAAEPGSAYCKPPEDFNPDEVFCFKYQRTVGRDNTVRFGEYRLQIMPTNGRLSYVKAKVEVHEKMDGSLVVYYKGQCLATKPAPAEAPVLRARSMERVAPDTTKYRESSAIGAITRKTSESQAPRYTKAGPNHPWRRPFKVHIDRGDKIAKQLW
jgi:hypothetical protein